MSCAFHFGTMIKCHVLHVPRTQASNIICLKYHALIKCFDLMHVVILMLRRGNKSHSFSFLTLSLSSQVFGKWPRILVGPIWKCVSFEQYVNDSDPSESCSVA
jgi:hypothetical protein